VKTDVDVDFELSLKAIRYQSVQVVPDQSRGGQAEVEEVAEVALLPDHLTVIELTNMLSDEERYVKRVIENPPRGGGRAGLLSRFWDIAGRHYLGIYPIDFHIVLTGEEQNQGGFRASAGSTTARITVQGSYVDARTQQQILNEWVVLRDLIDNKLRKLSDNRRTPRISSGQTESDQPTTQSQYREESPFVPPQRMGPAADHARAPEPANRVSTLRQRRDAATDAVLSGRIDNETYRQITASIDAELADLN
jgi:hypothetical protein